MDINATLLGQMITFGIFVWFTDKFVLPIIKSSMDKRKQVILDGLDAAKKGHEKLKQAEEKYIVSLKEAKFEYDNIISNANKQANSILDEAKNNAINDKNEIISSGRKQIERELNKVKLDLRNEMIKLIIQGSEKILSKSINEHNHSDILDNFIKKL